MTPRFVVLVSDRCVTDGRTGRVISDRENKSIVLYEQMIMGYTGLAYLGGMPTDRWIVQTLIGVPPAKSATVLAAETAAAIKAMRLEDRYRSHAYLAVGWLMDRATERRIPTSLLISNFHDEQGRRIPPQDSFAVVRRSIGGSRVGVRAVGVPLSITDIRALRRKVGNSSRLSPNRPDGIIKNLTETLQAVASSDPSVGSEMLVTCFPKVAVMQIGVLTPLLGQMSWSESYLQAVYVGTDAHKVQYIPAQVSEEIGTWGMTFGPVNPSN
jgi:hypothetical protein